MTSILTSRAALLAAALALGTSVATAQISCVETNIGSAIAGAGDDTLSGPFSLGFNFPFNGSTYDTVYISSNGFFYLWNTGGTAPTGSACCSQTWAGLSGASGTAGARIAPYYRDLNCTGHVLAFNSLTGPNRAAITWQDVVQFGRTEPMTFQCQLYDTGEIVFNYDARVRVYSSTGLVGMANLGGADPGQSDISATPFTVAAPRVYQLFTTTAQLDLQGKSILFTPNGLGYNVSTLCQAASSLPYATGCPTGCGVYQQFTSGNPLNGSGLHFLPNGSGGYIVTPCASCFDSNIGAALGQGDDTLSINNALGFSFPYCGTSTTAIDICSNGFVWLQTGSTTSTDFSESTSELVTLQDRIAAWWDDLLCDATGDVHFNALPGVALVTWDNVQEYPTGGNRMTAQLKLFPDGSFVISLPSVPNLDGIVGYHGGAVPTGYAVDFTTVPFNTGAPGLPMGLAAQAGARPSIGGSFPVDMTNLPASTLTVAWLFGLTQTSLDLGFLGAPGCLLVQSNDLFWAGEPAAPPSWTMTLGIPPISSLSGVTIQSQALALAPGANALGVVFSNGLSLTFGL
ncbi:MAG: hypothetical protein U1F36_13460 [Planctomycetota bacterium]